MLGEDPSQCLGHVDRMARDAKVEVVREERVKLQAQDTTLGEQCAENGGYPPTQNGDIRFNPAKRNVLDLKNETCKNRGKRNVLKFRTHDTLKQQKSSPKRAAFIVFER